jgi:uncharacterized protein YndB with AHSA1/START domain
MTVATPTPADDYGIATAPDAVRIERLLPGPIERVWDYLVDPRLRATWLAAGALEPRVGGAVELAFHHATLTPDDDAPPAKYADLCDGARMQGRITRFEPPHRLAYTWGEAEGADSHVLFELSARGERVQLVVTHTRLPSREQMLSVAAGWHTHLDILRDRLADRAPQGFWHRHTALEAEYDRRLPG